MRIQSIRPRLFSDVRILVDMTAGILPAVHDHTQGAVIAPFVLDLSTKPTTCRATPDKSDLDPVEPVMLRACRDLDGPDIDIDVFADVRVCVFLRHNKPRWEKGRGDWPAFQRAGGVRLCGRFRVRLVPAFALVSLIGGRTLFEKLDGIFGLSKTLWLPVIDDVRYG